MAGTLATAWGIGGVLLLLAQALYRLVPRALEALAMELSAPQWIVLAVWLAFMGYAEGWRGFHQRFSPKVVERAFTLREAPTPLRGLLAPAYAMALFGAPRRAMIVSWSLLVGIVALVILVRFVPQPWRGIVDAGVVLGLTIGSVSIAFHTARALRG